MIPFTVYMTLAAGCMRLAEAIQVQVLTGRYVLRFVLRCLFSMIIHVHSVR